MTETLADTQKSVLRMVLDDYYFWERGHGSTTYTQSPEPAQRGGLPDGWVLEATSPAPVILKDAAIHLVRRGRGGWLVVYRRIGHTDVLGCAATLAVLYNDFREQDYPAIDGTPRAVSHWLGEALVARYHPTNPAQANARVMVALHGWALADIPHETAPVPSLPTDTQSTHTAVPRPVRSTRGNPVNSRFFGQSCS